MSTRLVLRSIMSNPGNRGQRTYRLLRAVAWQLSKRTLKRPRVISLFNGAKFKAQPDCVVSSALIYASIPEFHEINFVRENLKPDDFVIDIGANVGHVSLLLSDLVQPDRMMLFEPTPETFRRLTENWRLNDFPPSSLKQLAVGAESTTATFLDTASPTTTNAQLQSPETAEGNTVTVQVEPLDKFRPTWNGQRIGLVKIDVEGFEHDVFQGAVETLRSDRPRLLMFESLEHAVDPRIKAILDDCRYTVFGLDGDGRPDRTLDTAQNLFAVPEEEFVAFAS